MVYKIDYVDGDVLTWSVTETGVTCEVDESYTPTIYVSVHGDDEFSTAHAALRDHPAVAQIAIVDERVSFRHDPEQVLQVDVVDLDAVNLVARMVSRWGSSGEYRCYNVDFSREFRYCLEKALTHCRSTNSHRCTLLCRRQSLRVGQSPISRLTMRW
jgi:DNA polymerase, archaea type